MEKKQIAVFFSIVTAVVLVFGMPLFVPSTLAAVPACPDITGGTGGGSVPVPDGNVDSSDLAYISVAMGSPVYDPLADLNGDGVITSQDASVWDGYRGRTGFSCADFLSAQSLAVATAASLAIAKSDGLTEATPGQATTYSITLTNSGGTSATDVKVTDTIPGNYGSVTAISDGGVLSGSTITWDGLTVPAAGAKVLTFQGSVAASLAVGTTTLTNAAVLGCTAAIAAQCQYSGTAVDTTTVTVARIAVAKPILSLVKQANATGPFAPGDSIEYTVTIANAASATANAVGVVLSDTLPSGLTYTVNGESTMTFSIGDIAPGASRTVTYSVTVGPSVVAGSYTNTATAKGSNTDAVNATATITIEVPQVLAETVTEEPADPEVQVLAETGPGLVDGLIALGAMVLAAAGVFTFRRVGVMR